MKSKFTRIWGVGLTIALLASLMVAAVPVSATDLQYSAVNTPSKKSEVLQAGTDINFLVAAADGTTMFAFDNGGKLWKSTNAGASWSAAETSATAQLTGLTLVDLAVSPRYATDGAVVAVTNNQTFYSADGGKTFTSVAPDSLATKLEGGTITSVDIGYYWKTGVLTLLIGIGGGGNAFSNVLKFELNQYSWSEVGAAGDNVTANRVVEVAFSPMHQSDAEFLCVAVDDATGKTYLNTHFALDSTAWDAAPRPPRVELTTSTTTANTGSMNATDAVIAFGSDFNGLNTTNTILVGTQDALGNGGVIRVSNLGDTTVKALNLCQGNIKSIAISGAIATGNVLVGMVGSNSIQRASGVTASSVTFSTSSKSPTGGAGAAGGAIVAWAGTAACAGTVGNDSAFSKSADGGATFNQLSLIDVGTLIKISIQDSAIVDANNMFVILDNTSAGYVAKSLFATNDGGKTWQRILTGATLDIVAPSPTYATDSTLYVTDTTSTIRKSVNGGASFTSEWVPAAVTAIAVVDKDTYFTGAVGELYKKGLYVSATGLSGTVKSIVLSPAYATDSTIFVGTDGGSVYISTNNGVSFSRVGASGSLGSGATVYVAPDPNFATNKTIYAVGSTDNTSGIKRTSSTSTSADWAQLDTDGGSLLGGGIAVSPAGTLYAASNVANKGIRRSLTPLITLSTPPTTDELADLALAFESMLGGNLPTTGKLPASSQLTDLSLISNKVLYAIEKGGSDTPFGESSSQFGYTDRLLTITDSLAPVGKVTGAPTPSSPAYKVGAVPALDTPDSATLTWKAVTGATLYDVWYATNSDFSNATKTTSDTTSKKITSLTSGKTYYWKVRVSAPQVSPWSDAWQFYTALPDMTSPGATLPYGPKMGEVDVSITPTFVWPTVVGATNYQFMIGEDPTFAIIDYSVNTGTINSHATDPKEPLKYSTIYYWRVRGTTDLPVKIGEVAEGSAWVTLTFTTMAEPAPVVTPQPTVITQPGETKVEVVQVPVEKVVPQAIPNYLLWTIIGVGAVLVIALIILIVRTRRVT